MSLLAIIKTLFSALLMPCTNQLIFFSLIFVWLRWFSVGEMRMLWVNMTLLHAGVCSCVFVPAVVCETGCHGNNKENQLSPRDTWAQVQLPETLRSPYTTNTLCPLWLCVSAHLFLTWFIIKELSSNNERLLRHYHYYLDWCSKQWQGIVLTSEVIKLLEYIFIPLQVSRLFTDMQGNF